MERDSNNNLKVAIIDPCYHRRGGHHHGVNRDLSQELCWLEPRVYADSRLELDQVSADYPLAAIITPAFSEAGYIDPKRYSTVRSYCEQARLFHGQLKSLDADILIAHTLLHFQLYGLGLYLACQQRKYVVVSLMFSPYEGLRSEASEQHDYLFTSIALRSLNDAALSNGHKITLGITSEYQWELLVEVRHNYPL